MYGQSIEDKLTNEMESHYNNLNKKLDKLQKGKPNKKKNVQPFNQQFHYHARTVNLSNIKFTQEELGLLNNGLQYSIETPLKKIQDRFNHRNRTGNKIARQQATNTLQNPNSKKMKQIITSDSQNTAVKRQS